MAAFDVGANLTGLTHHPDHASKYMAMVYTDRIAGLGAIPSTGTVGDSCDNAMAEAVNALYKAELIRALDPGARPRRSNLQPWNGYGGEIINDSTPSSTTAPRQKPNTSTTLIPNHA